MAVIAPGLALSPQILWGTLLVLFAAAAVALTPSIERWRAVGLLLLCGLAGADCAGMNLAAGAARGTAADAALAALLSLGIWAGWTALFVLPAAGLGGLIRLPAWLARALNTSGTALALATAAVILQMSAFHARDAYRDVLSPMPESPCNMAPFILFLMLACIYPPIAALIALLWGLRARG